MMNSQIQEARLVLRAQSGDLKALDTLLEKLQTPLFRYIAGVVGKTELAEDVLQDVLIIICRKIKWLHEPRVFRSWAFRIASREAIRKVKQEKWRQTKLREVMMAGENSENILISDEFPAVSRIPELIGAAPAASRAVLLLHYQEGMTLQAVADVLDLPVGTVKSRLAYGLSCIRKAMKPSP